MRCLAKAPAERYPDAESLELALAECSCAGKWDKYQAKPVVARAEAVQSSGIRVG